MTTEKLLENLRAERTRIDSVIMYIERLLGNGRRASKAADILETVDGPKKHGPYKQKKAYHWTQTAAGKKKMARIQKAVWARKHAEEKGFK